MPMARRPLYPPSPYRPPMGAPPPPGYGAPAAARGGRGAPAPAPAPPPPSGGPGWTRGKPPVNPPVLTQAQKQAKGDYSGHAQYDPELFAMWKQQHPNDPRAQQFLGTGGLPPEVAAKWNAA